MNFYEAQMKIKECRSHRELLKLVEYIVAHQKELQFDDYQISKLEDAGMKKYERIERDLTFLAKNSKGRR
jgi:hypothetical protein